MNESKRQKLRRLIEHVSGIYSAYSLQRQAIVQFELETRSRTTSANNCSYNTYVYIGELCY